MPNNAKRTAKGRGGKVKGAKSTSNGSDADRKVLLK